MNHVRLCFLLRGVILGDFGRFWEILRILNKIFPMKNYYVLLLISSTSWIIFWYVCRCILQFYGPLLFAPPLKMMTSFFCLFILLFRIFIFFFFFSNYSFPFFECIMWVKPLSCISTFCPLSSLCYVFQKKEEFHTFLMRWAFSVSYSFYFT